MKKHIHINSSLGGFQTSTKRIHSGRVNGKDVFTEFMVISGVCHMIRNSVMNGILYTAESFDDLANRLMASNERIPAPLSHPSDESGNFVSAKDPLILSAHGIFSFDTNWRVSGDKLISDTYIDLNRASQNENAGWLIERINNKQPIDRSTGLELMISENSGVGPDGEEYSIRVEEIINLDHSAILNPESEPGAKNGGEGVGIFVNANGESAIEVAELHANSCSPNLSLPLAPADYTWNETEAVNRIRKFSGSESAPSTNYRKFFMEFDANNVGDFGAYKIPFADVIDGRPYAVPAALEAINAESVADSDRQRIMANVEHYKSKMEKSMPNSKLAQFLNWLGKKFGVNAEMEYNRFVVNNIEYKEVDPMKEKILAALNAARVKTDGLDDDALFAAYNEAMTPKAETKPEVKVEDAVNAKVLDAVNALTEEVKQLKAANAAAAQAEIDAVAAQVANAGIMELEDAKKLSVKSLNGLLAKSGVVVANGAGGFSAAPQFEPMPE